MKITLIGAGNVARALGRKMKIAGHEIGQVYSRGENGRSLAEELDARHINQLEKMDAHARLCLICVSDSSIAEIAERLKPMESVIAHTAGGIPMETLRGASSRYGVFYPLQTISAHSEPGEIPILLEASDDDTYAIMEELANSISGKVMPAGSLERSQYHLAAVFANNFTNALYQVAFQLCKKQGLRFEMLLPLVRETTSRLENGEPSAFQTGPAMRGDENTINHHRGLLAREPEMLELYDVISSYIQQNIRKKAE